MISLAILLSLRQAPSVDLKSQIEQAVVANYKAHADTVAVGIFRDGKLMGSKGDLSAHYRIGSVTKQFTAGLIVLLKREGRLDYDDKLGKWVADVPDSWKNVTIRQMLHHTSGIPNYTESDKMEMLNAPKDPNGIWRLVKDVKVDFAPEKGWKYSNTGYVLLGLVAEKASKKPYYRLLKDRILKPLSMTQTGEESQFPVISSFYLDGTPTPKFDMRWPYSAGAIVSTANDLAKWDFALRGVRLFTEGEKKLMWSPNSVNKGYGFGWNVTENAVSHGGGIPGFSSYITRSLLGGTSVIVLSNVQSSPTTVVGNRLLKIAEPEVVVPVQDPNAALTKTHREFFESVLNGTFKAESFAEQFLKNVPEDKIRAMSSQLKQMGEVTVFKYKGEKGKTRIYKVTLGENEFDLYVTQEPDGKYAGFQLK
jgi:D-alanyl-D-alanine carboxypeptidase